MNNPATNLFKALSLLTRSLVLTSSLLMTNLALAGVIYDESVSGDLPNSSLATYLQLFDGDNTILGSVQVKTGTGAFFNHDRFRLLLGGGLSITNIEVSFFNLNTPSATTLRAVTEVNNLGPAPSLEVNIRKYVYNDTIIDIPTTNFPLSDDEYRGSIGVNTNGGAACAGTCTFDYELTYQVSSVPEPSTIFLLFTGFVLVGVNFKRQRKILS